MASTSLKTPSVIPTLETGAEIKSGPALNPTQLAWRRFLKHRMAVVGMIGLIALVLFIVIGSIAIPEDSANRIDLKARKSPPSLQHWFGTDSTGRDAFPRIVYGGQISLFVGFTSVVLAVTIGTVVGGVAAYFGGWLDNILMRFTEAMLSVPQLFLLIVLGKLLGNDIPTLRILDRQFSGSVIIIIFVIGVTSWMYLARIVRANVLSIKELDYVSAARALGVSDTRIFFTHLIPNTIAPIIVSATLGLAGAIITEAYVSFLGLGVQPPTATWGNMLQTAISFIQEGLWWMWLFPCIFIILTVLCINFIGDGLRDALDPRTAKHIN